MARFSKGDHVRWNTSQGETHGHVVDVRTRDFTLDGQGFRACKENHPWAVRRLVRG
jgi:hypothetical protein